jgi:ABC-type antimicrobial peptide transport system permease subunit
METFIKDIRYGLRSLARRPGFTALAIITLALGIGASTSIFSVVDAVLLRPLPYPHAEQIVQLREINEKGGKIPFTEPNFIDLRSRNHTLEALAQYSGQLTTVTGANEPVRALTYLVSADFFRVLGTKALVGRTFVPEEQKPGGAPVAVVSYGFWQRLLGAKSDLNGTTLHVLDQNVAVVGVMPPEFAFPTNAEVWIPRELFPADISRSAHNWSVVARTRPGVSVKQARTDVSAIAKQLKQEYGKDMDAVDFTAVPQQEYMVGDVRGALLVMFTAVGFLLVVACANVANLLLAQVTARQRDFAVRSALGATRLRLARQFVTENVLLVLIAGALGVLLSFWGVDVLLSLNQQGLPRMHEIGVDTRAVGFTVGLSLLIGDVLGLVPVLRFSPRTLEKSLRETNPGSRGYAGQGLRSLLVVAQMALTVVLLAAAGLLGKSFYRLLQIDPGFRTDSTVAMELSLPEPPADEQRYKQLMQAYTRLLEQGVAPEERAQLNAEEERQRLFTSQLLERLSATPGVVAVGTISDLPLSGGGPDGTFLIANNPARKGHAEYRRATAGYFAAMRIPVLRGRLFDASDKFEAPNAAVVSQSVVDKYWPNEDPIGQTIQFGNMDGDLRLLHVVGVVGDIHDYGLNAPAVPTVYANSLQRLPSSNWTVVARAQSEPSTLAPAMRGVVRSLDPQLPLKFRTLDQVFSSSLSQQRFSLVIFGVFAATALILAALGIYGITAYAVAQRTHEIGIRMALGAQRRDVLRLVFRQALLLAGIGAVAGLVGAYAAKSVLQSFLFEVAPTDFSVFVAVPVVLLFVALVACLVPARRATRVDPLIALRHE